MNRIKTLLWNLYFPEGEDDKQEVMVLASPIRQDRGLENAEQKISMSLNREVMKELSF